MPSPKAAIANQKAPTIELSALNNESRLQALRSAAQVGMADIKAGRYQTFDSKASLKAHLKAIGNKAMAQT